MLLSQLTRPLQTSEGSMSQHSLGGGLPNHNPSCTDARSPQLRGTEAKAKDEQVSRASLNGQTCGKMERHTLVPEQFFPEMQCPRGHNLRAASHH